MSDRDEISDLLVRDATGIDTKTPDGWRSRRRTFSMTRQVMT